jgi:hypothetical protein
LEKHHQELIEEFDPAVDDLYHLIAVVKACTEYVFTLEIDQLLSHLDLNELCAQLKKNLTPSGVKQIDMKQHFNIYLIPHLPCSH